MAKVRQLADLFLRGALANETMKNLTQEEKEQAEIICEKVMNHEVLVGHKNMFMNKLGSTIRCDFTDRLMAKQEYRITIWRGVIYLLYHREYSFRCTACKAASYQSQRGAPIKFDRRWHRCPACKKYSIDDPGDSGLDTGSFIVDSDYESLLLSMTEMGQAPPSVCSCVEPIPGNKKIEDPSQILNDPIQIKKFFGEFIWNYFRQSLKENKITHHGKENKRIIGPVDMASVQCIIQLLKVSKVNFQCDPHSPVDGFFAIYCQPYSVDPADFLELMSLKEKIESVGGILVIDGTGPTYFDNAILVKDMYGSAPFVELDIAVNDQVRVVTNSVSKDNNDEPDIIQQIERPNVSHDIREFEQNDAISVIREALPEGDCRTVLDLITNQGKAYDEFVEMYPGEVMNNHGVPRQNRMAEFIGCSQKQIKSYRQVIHIQVVVHGIGR